MDQFSQMLYDDLLRANQAIAASIPRQTKFPRPHDPSYDLWVSNFTGNIAPDPFSLSCARNNAQVDSMLRHAFRALEGEWAE